MNELSKIDTSNTVSTHRDYRDISFYEDNSKITKVNLTADIPLIQHDTSSSNYIFSRFRKTDS
jgi:hypothetical protein